MFPSLILQPRSAGLRRRPRSILLLMGFFRPLRWVFTIEALVAVAACFPLIGQQPEKPPPPANPSQSLADSPVEPDTADIFYGLRQHKLIALERQTPTLHHTSAGLIAMTVKSVFEFPGARS